MINEKEYNLLNGLKNSPLIDELKFYYELQTFFKDEFITYNRTDETPTAIIYNGFLLTPKGERAIEEYENFLQSVERDKETVNIAHEANDIAKEANTISQQSNTIARHSKNLSVGAIIVSIVSALATIAGIIVSALSR